MHNIYIIGLITVQTNLYFIFIFVIHIRGRMQLDMKFILVLLNIFGRVRTIYD